MNVTFVLPGCYRYPIGGHKVVFEYANYLDDHGHNVTVVMPPNRMFFTSVKQNVRERLRNQAWFLHKRLIARPLIPWFPVRPGVRLRPVPNMRPRDLPVADALFATAWSTARFVDGAPADRGEKFYLLQHFEDFSGDPEETARTWKLPMRKVVIARWLQTLAASFGEADRTALIPNGLDHARFTVTTPLDRRFPHRVGMLYHTAVWKGTEDGLAALEAARAQAPDLQAVLFGTDPRPAGLPEWIEYVHKPSPEALVALYNGCSIFLHPSWAEGLPAPPAEAMACGCALVAAGNDGVMDYARPEDTALVAPIKDPEALSRQLLRLLHDDALRTRIAEAGGAHVRRFTWDAAGAALERLLLATCGRPQDDRRTLRDAVPR